MINRSALEEVTVARGNPPSRFRALLFRAVPMIVTIFVAAGLFYGYQTWWNASARGQRLNQDAWAASFVERGLELPDGGPREGFWGSRLAAKTPHDQLGWHEAPISIEGLVQIDERGHQHFRSSKPARQRVLIIGGSVAFGAYASSIRQTYFHRLGAELEKQGLPVDISVIAAGAWKSSQDFEALVRYGAEFKPDVVVFINGLNDLTSGATADALFGERVETNDGARWHELYHQHDYSDRVGKYVANMRRAVDWAHDHDWNLVVVLQPSLFHRDQPTPLEQRLMNASLEPHLSQGAIQESYQSMRFGLAKLASQKHVEFINASRLFDGETATTFADGWHFSDAGHAILAQSLVGPISEILACRQDDSAQ
jgi:lysophospholipase L1-like esterase